MDSILCFPNKDGIVTVYDVPWLAPENLHDLDSIQGGVQFFAGFQFSDIQSFYQLLPPPDSTIPGGQEIVGVIIWYFACIELIQNQNDFVFSTWLGPTGEGIYNEDTAHVGLQQVFQGFSTDIPIGADNDMWSAPEYSDPLIWDVNFGFASQMEFLPDFNNNAVCALDAVAAEIFYDDIPGPPAVDDGYVRSKRSRGRGWA